VAQHPDQPLPGLPLLLPQRAAQVGKDHEPVRHAALAKLAPPEFPPAGGPREDSLERARRLALEQEGDAQVRGARPGRPGGRSPQQLLAGPVREPEPAVLVEGEDGDVDFLHDGTEQRRGLDGSQAPLPEQGAQRVRLVEDQTQWVLPVGPAGIDGVVLVLEGVQQVRQRLERSDHGPAHGQSGTRPDGDEEHRQRVASRPPERVSPDPVERNERSRQAGEQRQEEDAPVVSEPASPHRP
jgi:hypothetical protein